MTAFKMTAITTGYFQRTPLTIKSVLAAFALDKDLLEGACLMALSDDDYADYKDNPSYFVFTPAHVITAAKYFASRHCGIDGRVLTAQEVADTLCGKIQLV